MKKLLYGLFLVATLSEVAFASMELENAKVCLSREKETLNNKLTP